MAEKVKEREERALIAEEKDITQETARILPPRPQRRKEREKGKVHVGLARDSITSNETAHREKGKGKVSNRTGRHTGRDSGMGAKGGRRDP